MTACRCEAEYRRGTVAGDFRAEDGLVAGQPNAPPTRGATRLWAAVRRYLDTGRVLASQPPVVRVSTRELDAARSNAWPSGIPAVRQLLNGGLRLDPGITFLVGENGSGKSTIREGIALAYGMSPEGGSSAAQHATRPTESPPSQWLDLQRGVGASRWGFFLRAETSVHQRVNPAGTPAESRGSRSKSRLTTDQTVRSFDPGKTTRGYRDEPTRTDRLSTARRPSDVSICGRGRMLWGCCARSPRRTPPPQFRHVPTGSRTGDAASEWWRWADRRSLACFKAARRSSLSSAFVFGVPSVRGHTSRCGLGASLEAASARNCLTIA